ncbi:MAG: SEL1-like repeat protein [gamma proteobacterium symbiont of Bathyaustriella thionipta]|nr:SEL1-like repeat protein [gamma proteobacterium symbiont of Bathyaustriella thionipta]MCU7950985.1 SEL1-like repeat protein [gamma proteobacterium symbiont of Bathyaustriella thionipta]MCU7954877.1 SEL1-like repeat protein [gamma proteobacterium symbiont of Bathyaustriella thionipta]MCU7957487.1 SEL1-like repeat protein [gamma proteobacterium symbiont of Bathyaustriella thionipta]MCU7968417.1 SEL1-like repeat protein [gamma proteobacterium symbiont of Bathyaustriella thionipta]
MKLFLLFFTISIILSGCNASIPKNENLQELSKTNAEQEIEPGSDAYYLNIAKDLYAAQQYKQVYKITTALAEKNNVEAQYLLGYLYYYGQGVPVDIKQGEKWITRAADSDYRPAIEALVLIKHGLTPDNKCLSVDLDPEKNVVEKQGVEKATINISSKSSSLMSNELKEGDVLITPKNNKAVQENTVKKPQNIEVVRSTKTWNRYTIQLIKTGNKQNTRDYANNFKNKYPDLKDYIITYQSKEKWRSFGVGFSTFENYSEAKIALNNLKSRLNDSTLFVKHLENYKAISEN